MPKSLHKIAIAVNTACNDFPAILRSVKERKTRKAQGARLAAARLAAGFRSARGAAIEHGWPESTYRAHETGGRTIGQDDAERYAKAFRAHGVEVSAAAIIFGGADDHTADCRGPETSRSKSADMERRGGVLEYDLRAGASYGGGYVVNGDDGKEGVKAEWFFPESWLRGEMRLRLDFTDILAVDGPSMLPDLAPGDRVLIDRSNRDPRPGGIFAVREDHSVIIKHVELIRNTDPPRIRCKSSNEHYDPFELILDGEHVAIIGRVAWKISKI